MTNRKPTVEISLDPEDYQALTELCYRLRLSKATLIKSTVLPIIHKQLATLKAED